MKKKGDFGLKLPDFKGMLSFGGVRTFRGGVHPNDMKADTCMKPIIDLIAPKTLVFPLRQHIGAEAVPCVSVGERVLMGQKIAEANGNVSANIHSSVSGTVTAIEPRPHPLGTDTMAIIIENDGRDEKCADIKTRKADKLSPGELVDIIREAGIVGMGGAAFPTHVKLSPPKGKKIEFAIVNGAECEPYLTSDHRAMLETADEVIEGLIIIMRIFGLKKGYIAIESNKPDAISHMRSRAALRSDAEIEVVELKTKYPQGSEKQIIDAVAGRKVPPGGLPMDVGAIVDNIDTCAAIARAVNCGEPLMRRIVTVGGDCVENHANFRVRIGTDFEYILEKCSLKEEIETLIMGGPMMGIAQSRTDVPVIKGTSGILAFKKAKAVHHTSCLRCGKCVGACPMHLMPNVLKSAVLNEDLEKLKKLNISDCISCGSCSFICPAGQNPLGDIKTGKEKLARAARQEVKN